MNSSGKKLILISFALAIIAASAAFIYLKSLSKPKNDVKEVTIPVASETIPERTKIEKKMLKEIKVPESTLISSYIKDSSEIIGKFTKEKILQNEGFIMDKISSTNENDLSFKIDENNRAVSLNVTGDTGVAYLIRPGDYVDVVVYITEKKDGQKIVRPEVAKTILENVKVLAVDMQISHDTANDSKDKMPNSFIITVSVPSPDVEKLVLSEDIGSIKLALRPVGNEIKSSTKGATVDDILQTNAEPSSSIADKSAKTDAGTSNKISFKYYTIKKGDTLKRISCAYYGTNDKYMLLKEFNNIKDENLIHPGITIKIPNLK
jgi:pilus assembly protein CpaB